MGAARGDRSVWSPQWLAPMVYLSLALLLGIVAAAGWSLYRQNEYRNNIQQAFTLEGHMATALSLLQDAETGQRGFLLTNVETYLGPYSTALPRIEVELAAIEELTADNPRHAASLERLRPAVAEKLAELASTITLFRANQRVLAMDMVQSDVGRQAMDRVRTIIADMRRAEGDFLADQLRLAAAASARLGWFILVAGGLVAFLGFVAFASLKRYTNTLVASRQELQEKNTALETEIHARQSIEQQFQQLQKMDALGKLTGGIAHDFNNMLAVVISSLNILQRRVAKGDHQIGEFVDAALDGARRATVLTSRLLAFSRQQPLDPKPVDINKLVSGMSAILHRTLGEQIQIETVLAAGLWRATADLGQLESSLLNLAVNARDAMPDGGKLTIETANAYLDDAYVKSHPEARAGQYVMIAISDTGPGMRPEVLARAFDPFFTTKAVGKGTGLGLSQVYGFVKQSGGHINLYSEIGQGTTIKIYLAKTLASALMPEAEKAAVIPMGRPETVILVLEDEDSVRKMTVTALRELGYTVIHTSRPNDALNIVRTNSSVDMVLTDVVMPEMNGRQFADIAVKEKPGLKVLYTTGYTQNAIVHNGVLDEGTNLLMKPFTLEQLGLKVHSVLTKQQ